MDRRVNQAGTADKLATYLLDMGEWDLAGWVMARQIEVEESHDNY